MFWHASMLQAHSHQRITLLRDPKGIVALFSTNDAHDEDAVLRHEKSQGLAHPRARVPTGTMGPQLVGNTSAFRPHPGPADAAEALRGSAAEHVLRLQRISHRLRLCRSPETVPWPFIDNSHLKINNAFCMAIK